MFTMCTIVLHAPIKMLKKSKGPQWEDRAEAGILADSDTGKEGKFLKHSQKSSVTYVGKRLDKKLLMERT